jgi:hypothetical protein
VVFVPMVPPQREASARAQDLGRRLKAEVEKFQAQYPGTSKEDLRAAAAIAIGQESVSVPPRRRVAAALVAGIIGLTVAATSLNIIGGADIDAGAWRAVLLIVAASLAGFVAVVIATLRRGR